MTFARFLVILAMVAILGGGKSPSASSQEFPDRPVKIVVPVSAGSQADIIARVFADELTKRWKMGVIVENRPGLPGVVGVAKSSADGYTILLNSNGQAVLSILHKNLTFDPIKDFIPIIQLAITPGIFITPLNGHQTLAEFIADARSKPRRFNFASAGLGSASSLGVELLKTRERLDIVHVPHKGIAEAHTSILRGDVSLFMTFFSAASDLIEGKKLRAVAVSTTTRLPALANVPTMQEAGASGYSYDPWFGLFAPVGTPHRVVLKVGEGFQEVATTDGIARRFAEIGVIIKVVVGDEFAKVVADDALRFGMFGGEK